MLYVKDHENFTFIGSQKKFQVKKLVKPLHSKLISLG